MWMNDLLVYVKEEVGGGSVRVRNVEQVWSGLSGEGGGGRVRATGHENHVVGCDSANGGDSGLDCLGPGGNSEVVGLIHNTKDDVGVVGVLGSQRRPQGGELIVSWATLSDNLSVPAGVVVDIYNALGAGAQAASHEVIIFAKVGGIKVTTDDTVGKVLPANGETEDVEVVSTRKVLHLGRAGGGVGNAINGACTISRTAKVETGNVHTSVGRVSTGGGRAGSGGSSSR